MRDGGYYSRIACGREMIAAPRAEESKLSDRTWS